MNELETIRPTVPCSAQIVTPFRNERQQKVVNILWLHGTQRIGHPARRFLGHNKAPVDPGLVCRQLKPALALWLSN